MRVVSLLLCLASVASGAPAASSAAGDCAPRLLVLSAFPGELDPLLGAATISRTDVVDGRSFYVGTLASHDVVLAMTGIGLANAEATTESALGHFACSGHSVIEGIVFSGVAGGPNIGDVLVPEHWTLDGVNDMPVDAAMYAVAQGLTGRVTLSRAVPAGDPACAGVDPTMHAPIVVEEEPQIRVGRRGASADGFEGRTFPCFPGGGDVFGCRPCRAPIIDGFDPQRSAGHALPFVDPSFFFGYFGASSPPPGDYVAVDMETAAVAAVAQAESVPFIAFRAVSDGDGDPLRMPGFPFQFFVYRLLAAQNAAAVTLAFLAAW